MSAELLRRYAWLLEANWKITYAHGYRSWYNPATGGFLNVTGWGTNHASFVQQNPRAFGLTPEQVATDTPLDDRDPRMFNLACGKGWIRVAGSDRNNPEKYMIFEGNDLGDLRKAVRLFFNDMGGALQNATVKIRTGKGEGGREIALRGNAEVKRFLQTGAGGLSADLDAKGGGTVREDTGPARR